MTKGISKILVNSKAFILTAITLGGSLEWYEIGIFISWPLLVEKRIAGFEVSLAESLNAGAILILVALALANGGARALGGWYFGKKGDEQGRKVAFPLTLLFATLPSWSLALLSFFISYEQWFTYSTALFALVKFFQGMPAGGELPGAVCYLFESANSLKDKQSLASKRFMCSFALLGPQIGLSLSAIVCLVLRAVFPMELLLTHIWRYVFIFSGLIGIAGYMMRKKIHETAEYLDLKVHDKVTHKPIKTLFSSYSSRVITASVLSIFEVIAFSVLTFVPYYYSKEPFNLNNAMIFMLTLSYSGVCIILLPLLGFLSSKFQAFPWLKTSIWGTVFFAPVLFFTLLNGQFIFSLVVNCILIFFLSIQAAILPFLLAQIFPVQVRYTGIAFSFNICDGVLWSAFTGVCFMFFAYNSPLFVLILPFAAFTFLFGRRMSQSNQAIYNLLN